MSVNRFPRLRELAVVAAAGLAIAGAGCGGENAASGPQRPVTARTVTIDGFEFQPEAITVPAGTTVTWRNVDSAGHTATSDRNGGFDSGPIQRGQSKAVTLKKKGTIPYHCDFHPFMKGRVVVD